MKEPDMQAAILSSYRDAVRFLPERFSPVAVAQTQRVKVVLTCFEPGQFIPVHSPGVDMALVILEGTGVVVAGDDEASVGPGAIVLVPAGDARGVKATTRLVAVHLVSLPPTESDHAEVQARLNKGAWR
jgi:quercetin dioxygenase-like cupin family protein